MSCSPSRYVPSLSARRASATSRCAFSARPPACHATTEAAITTSTARIIVAAIGCLRIIFHARLAIPARRALIRPCARYCLRSSANSPAVAYRLSGSFSIAFWQIVSRSTGMRGLKRRGGRGSLVRMPPRISSRDSPGNGRLWVSISYSTAPREYTSVRWSSFILPEAICSGDMYAGVPISKPLTVIPVPGPRAPDQSR